MRILVTSKSFSKVDPAASKLLEEKGFILEHLQAPVMTSSLIASRIKGIDCLIVGNDPVGPNVFEAADCLKLVHMHGTGLDGIDVESATAHGVLVSNVTGANKNAVAELTLALMLTVGRRIDKHIELFKQGRWERTAGHELSSKTVGIIGLGNIGRRLVELLKGFDVKVIGYDPYADRSWAEAHGVRLADHSDKVFTDADFLVLSAPLTPETEHIVCAQTLSLMKRSAYLINTARGALVDEQALTEAVQSGRIAGAAIDVYRQEPPSDDSPLRLADIVMTPHIAATSYETSSAVSMIVARQIIEILIDGHKELAVNHQEVSALV
jgi:D-3-phosphoglycerate dehydrogenase